MNEWKMKDWENLHSNWETIKNIKIMKKEMDAWCDDKDDEDDEAKQGPSWEDFLRIVDAVSKGETPEWLILKGDRASKAAAQAWKRALEENKRRADAERARQRREEVKKAALEKLTKEEREALGLK